MSQLKGLKVATPEYDDAIPSTGEKVKLKPFRVADEKVLLMASNSEDTTQMANAINQVVKNCVIRNSNADLSYFDLEYLFVKLRSVSIGEVAKFGYKCVSCQTVNEVEIDISKVKVEGIEGHEKNVKITDNLMFGMKYPNAETIMKYDNEDVGAVLMLIVECVEKVYTGEDVIEVTEAEKEDLLEIVENLTSNQYQGLSNFLETMPKLKEETSFVCESCEKENKVVMEGMRSFF